MRHSAIGFGAREREIGGTAMERRGFCSLLLRDVFLSERIFRESLRTLIEKERSLIDSLIRSQGGSNQSE